MSEEREQKLEGTANDEPSTENDDVEAHKKAHSHPADSTANDDGDDVEAHVKRHNV